jgi:hypothetical protein
MSLRNRRVRERRQRVLVAIGHTVKWLLILGALGGVGLLAHRTGSELAQREVVRLSGERDAARAEAEARQGEAARLRQEAEAARAEAEVLRRRYEAEVPTGQLAELLGEVRARLDGGIAEGLLREAIRDAAPLRACDGPPIVRRFRITAADRPAPEDATTFFEGLVRVQAAAPAGFDQLSRTMLVIFSGQGMAEPVAFTGVPAAQTFRIGRHEATVTVTPSPIPGFAAASMPTCRPE